MKNIIRKIIKSILIFVAVVISLILFIFGFMSLAIVVEKFYPNQNRVNFEERNTVQKVLNMDIPDFNVKKSMVTHQSDFDSEVTIKCEIYFIEDTGDTFFHKIDSIIQVNGKDVDQEGRGYWAKEGDVYEYILQPMGGYNPYIGSDGFFYFSIEKNSRKGEIVYGNY